MKKLTLSIFLAAIMYQGFSQFQGTLTYETIYVNKVVTTYNQNSTMGRIDAKIYPMKGTVPDTANAKDQDPLIFDFNANRQITLHAKMKMAITTGYTYMTMEKIMKLSANDVVVTLVGIEQVGSYSCQHFHVNVNKAKKDLNLWITTALGDAKMFICPAFLYYPPGCIPAQKIIAAGGNGVVIKATSGPLTITLTNYSKRTPPNNLFKAPADYTSQDNSALEQSLIDSKH